METKLQVLYKGKEIIPDSEDSFIGNSEKFEPGSFLELVIAPANGAMVFEKKRNSAELIRLRAKQETGVLRRKFLLCDDRYSGCTGWLYPVIRHNNSNRLNIVEFDDNDNFRLWEAGLFAQDGNLFFATQLTREGFCKKEEFPKGMIPRKQEIADASLFDNVARVMWFNTLSGVACVATSMRTARVHWSEIMDDDRRQKRLDSGNYIVFNRLEATNDAKTDFEFEIRGGAKEFRKRPTSAEIKSAFRLFNSKNETPRLNKETKINNAFATLADLFNG